VIYYSIYSPIPNRNLSQWRVALFTNWRQKTPRTIHYWLVTSFTISIGIYLPDGQRRPVGTKRQLGSPTAYPIPYGERTKMKYGNRDSAIDHASEQPYDGCRRQLLGLTAKTGSLQRKALQEASNNNMVIGKMGKNPKFIFRCLSFRCV
jgi:hypothetical protein